MTKAFELYYLSLLPPLQQLLVANIIATTI